MKVKRLSRRVRAGLGIALVAGLALSSSPTWAAITPDSAVKGPVSGGTPLVVQLPEDITQVAAGLSFSAALEASGNIYFWGKINDQLPAPKTPTLKQAPSGVRFTAITAGHQHVLALANNGSVYGWGKNNDGELGNGKPYTEEFVEIKHPTGGQFTAIGAGQYFSVALDSQGDIYSWGNNSRGQLGNNSTDTKNADSPVRVHAPGIKFTSIGVQSNHVLALGTVENPTTKAPERKTFAWGSNYRGNLGDGTKIRRHSPVEVKLPEGVTHFVSVSSGAAGAHSVALGSDGHHYAWGGNVAGNLGDGTTQDRNTPTRVAAPQGLHFAPISTGWVHTLGKSLGASSVYTWGGNFRGQLGTTGNDIESHRPVQSLTPDSVSFSSVAAGGVHNVALGSDGLVYTWGGNQMGQLGYDQGDYSSTPGVVPFSKLALNSVIFGASEAAADPKSTMQISRGKWLIFTPAFSRAGTVPVAVTRIVDGKVSVNVDSSFTYE
ncbi:hypothetical protein [Lysinibacter sp. HNR]|uniref:RCC1 domain-containing protein n=1 Tax=Lysinibacter sp. HNR TaxID=3031408 RepID=UPI002434DD15|nr:hypothetical protein [Lysinibacter sp. HNR]WGD36860.1 hypothetical protein FrondiHNR_10445 [Lysinibacter sp. HNR]